MPRGRERQSQAPTKGVDDGASLRPIKPPSSYSDVDAVARHGSIRKAAEALHVVSSALNRRILELEEELGFELFERLPRGVRPTAAGELFLAYVRRSLKDLRQLEAQIAGLQGLMRGSIRIAVAESVTTRFLPEAIMAYQSEHPRVCFHVKVDGPVALREKLLSDEVELILTHEAIDIPSVRVLAAIKQPLCALVATGHPLASRTSLRLSDCAGYPLALPDESLAARGLLDMVLERSALQLEPAMVCNSIEATRVFARAQGGVCFQFHLDDQWEYPGMVVVPLNDPELHHPQLSLAVRRGRVLPSASAAFAEQLTRLLERRARS
jgi:DNA-binding transcriptional LysR family regulator